MPAIFLTCEVSIFPKFIDVNDVQPLNIPPISVIDDVSNLDISILIIFDK